MHYNKIKNYENKISLNQQAVLKFDFSTSCFILVRDKNKFKGKQQVV